MRWKSDGRFYDKARVLVGKNSREWPATVKRPKPLDLFANSTPRTVTTYVEEAVGMAEFWGYGGSLYYYGPFRTWADPSLPPLALRSQTVSDFRALDRKALQRIKNQSANLAQSLAEHRQATDMLFGAARDIVKTFHSLRSGRAPADFIRQLRNPDTRSGRRLANRWLEYQYGWRPFMSDVDGVCRQLSKHLLDGYPQYFTLTDEQTAPVEHSSSGRKGKGRETVKRKVRVRFKVSNSSLKAVSEIGFTNPALLAWELIPYSFVVDWFIEVGDWLSAFDALVGVEDAKISRSYEYELEWDQTLVSSGYTKIVGNPNVKINVKDRVRLGVGSLTPPAYPAIGEGLSIIRAANATALLRQLIRG